jgi:flagellar biosynthetic protein FliP
MSLLSATPKQRFACHYIEMVIAMFVGMAVLALPARMALAAADTSWSELGTAAMLLAMAVEMTLPMVAWMRFRGHGWRPSGEMAAAMLLPTFVAIGLDAAGLVGDTGVLMAGEHVAMLGAMLGAMLLRPDEYTHEHHVAHEAVAA